MVTNISAEEYCVSYRERARLMPTFEVSGRDQYRRRARYSRRRSAAAQANGPHRRSNKKRRY